jgi:hypothetical protein
MAALDSVHTKIVLIGGKRGMEDTDGDALSPRKQLVAGMTVPDDNSFQGFMEKFEREHEHHRVVDSDPGSCNPVVTEDPHEMTDVDVEVHKNELESVDVNHEVRR